jgi:hypothetical protein
VSERVVYLHLFVEVSAHAATLTPGGGGGGITRDNVLYCAQLQQRGIW